MMTELLILGHTILFGISVLVSASGIYATTEGVSDEGHKILGTLFTFAYLEIIYWILHWVFV